MCTLVVAHRTLRRAPVAVAANRDERLDRPSRPPARIEGDPPAVAPRDAEAGGTWIGYNAAGLVVALTNRWVEDALSGERSRGLLVRDLLSCRSAAAAASALEDALAATRYEGFNLLAADAETALVFEWDGTLRVSSLAPGVHAVTNAGYDDRFDIPTDRRDAAKRQIEGSRALRRDLRPAADEGPAEWLERAGDALGDHEYGVCVHGDGFGTRSASLIALADDGSATYRFADGPPCTATFERVDVQI